MRSSNKRCKKRCAGDELTGYDRGSQRKWRLDLTPAAQAHYDRFFGYDDLGQVKTAGRGTLNGNRTEIGGVPEEAEAWRYDEQGNWERYLKAADGTTEIDQHRRHNRSNQIVAIDGSNSGVAYDRNGNMRRVPTGEALEGSPRHLKWNAWNQMVEVRDEGDGLIQRNVYDALFRRTTRELPDATVIHCYYNDQWRPVEERVGDSEDPSAVYYWGARHRDDLARRDRDTNGDGTLDEPLWCLMDYFDPIAVIDGEGEVAERYGFAAFGLATILAPDYSARMASVVAWNFLFHGQFEDAETGWQNYGFRFYMTELGVWPSKDPINGFTAGTPLSESLQRGALSLHVPQSSFGRVQPALSRWHEITFTQSSAAFEELIRRITAMGVDPDLISQARGELSDFAKRSNLKSEDIDSLMDAALYSVESGSLDSVKRIDDRLISNVSDPQIKTILGDSTKHRSSNLASMQPEYRFCNNSPMNGIDHEGLFFVRYPGFLQACMRSCCGAGRVSRRTFLICAAGCAILA